VATAFMRVLNLLTPAGSLFAPEVQARVLEDDGRS
jgi:hypothetical protein